MAHSDCDSFLRFSFRPGFREFSERLHFAHSRGTVRGFAGVALPVLPDANQTLRQYSGGGLADVTGKMPDLRPANFTNVPDCGVPDGAAVCAGVAGIRADVGDAEMDGVFVPDCGPGGYGFACAHPSGPGEFSRDGCGPAVFPGHSCARHDCDYAVRADVPATSVFVVMDGCQF